MRTGAYDKPISPSYPFKSIAENYEVPYTMVLQIAQLRLHPDEFYYWGVRALADLTAHIGNWGPPSFPEESLTVARAAIMSEILEKVDEQLRKHRTKQN